MGCAASRELAATTRLQSRSWNHVCRNCCRPLGDLLPGGRYVCHGCGTIAVPRRSTNVAHQRRLQYRCSACRTSIQTGVTNCPSCRRRLIAPWTSIPEVRRMLRMRTSFSRYSAVQANAPSFRRSSAFRRSGCRACYAELPNGVEICLYCGALLGRRTVAAENGMRMLRQNTVASVPAALVETRQPVDRSIALDNSNEALEKLITVMDLDEKTVQTVLRRSPPRCAAESSGRGPRYHAHALPFTEETRKWDGPRRWSCPDCTFHNVAEATACTICERIRLGNEDIVDPLEAVTSRTKATTDLTADRSVSSEDVCLAINDAIDAMRCSVCLEVYSSPSTLPCGHSLCGHHIRRLQKKSCPICRSTFADNQLHRTRKSNAALRRNIKTLVLLLSLEDPDRDTIRDAREMFGFRDETDLPQAPQASDKC